MGLYFEILDGPLAGSRYFLDTGQTLAIGRSPAANISLPEDPALSRNHCSLECRQDGSVVVRDLGSANGTWVNHQKIRQAVVAPGDVIVAGSLAFAALPGDAPREPHRNSKAPMAGAPLITHLCSSTMPLFALLDAACDPHIIGMIDAAEERIQCLYDGRSTEDLAPWAPYLVELPKSAPLLAHLLKRGWGKGWASYFVAQDSFENLRHHFRKFLLVKLDDGRDVYFRFYDPRVLREFLPASNAAELRQFFGPVKTWLIESRDPKTLLKFSEEMGRMVAETVSFEE